MPQRHHRQKDSLHGTVLGLAILASPFVCGVYLIVAVALGWPASSMQGPAIVVGIAAVFWVVMSWPSDPFRDVEAPGWHVARHPSTDEVAKLWQGQPAPVRGRVRTILHREILGRRVSVVETVSRTGSSTTRVLIHLDGPLPKLKLWPQGDYLAKRRDATRLEDFELNDWYNIATFDDRSTKGRAFAHAVLRPRAMEVLLAHPPTEILEIRGWFLWTSHYVSPERLGSVEHEIRPAVEFANTIEGWVYQGFRSSMP